MFTRFSLNKLKIAKWPFFYKEDDISFLEFLKIQPEESHELQCESFRVRCGSPPLSQFRFLWFQLPEVNQGLQTDDLPSATWSAGQ